MTLLSDALELANLRKEREALETRLEHPFGSASQYLNTVFRIRDLNARIEALERRTPPQKPPSETE